MPAPAILRPHTRRHARAHSLPPAILPCFQLLVPLSTLMVRVMTLPTPNSNATMTPSERERLLEALLLKGEPELAFTPRGNPDPRLLRLVDFLARQAARKFYEAEKKQKQESSGS